MLILAFDTTSEHGGVAIYRDHECLASVCNEGPANLYSITLFQMVDRALAEAGREQSASASLVSQSALGLRDINLFAVANGPGSFTGIRVGLAAAQGWSKAFARPVVAVSVLEAMVEEAGLGTEWAIPVLDARRGEFFLGLFRRVPRGDTHCFEAAGQGWVSKPSGVRAFLEEQLRSGGKLRCVTRQHDRVAQALRNSLPKSIEWQSIKGPLMGAIARLAFRAHLAGKLQTPAELDAYYIRRSDAELHWRG